MELEHLETRRLTGPNLLLDRAGAVTDVAVRADDGEQDVERRVALVWEAHATAWLDAVGWADELVAVRRWAGGVTLAFTAEIDVLYAACEVAEAAWATAATALTAGGPTPPAPPAEEVARLRAAIAEEADPALLALRDAAEQADVAFLWDDDEVSLGLGRSARTWTRVEVPRPEAVDAATQGRVPVVLVTGTNGKSTTVRMLAHVLRHAGMSPGLTSTDGIVVGDEVVERGDFSGPGGARTLLRHTGVGAAVLEVARGGLLRRGLPLERADVSVVTNIAEDHLGEYGIVDTTDLAHAKLIVSKAVRRGGLLVCNADDPLLADLAPDDVQVGWTSQDPDSYVVRHAVDRGGRAWVVLDGVVTEVTSRRDVPVVAVADVPATLGGAARHNVANLLSAVAAARRLEVPVDVVASALATFRGDSADNPGRANRFSLDGATLVVDYAHNLAGVEAMVDTLAALPAQRRLVMIGEAGDRPDDLIARMVGALHAGGADHVVAVDLPSYLRGREPGEVPDLVRRTLLDLGVPPARVETAEDPLAGTRLLLEQLEPGDVALLLVLEQREEVVTLLRARGATEG
ncbi:MAG: Mur ligase family protein [Actinomycetes bacterium]